MVMKHNRGVLSVGITSFAALALLLNLTSPSDLGPAGVLLFFICLYVLIFSIITTIWKLYYKMALGRAVFRVKDYLYSAILSFAPVMLLIARSFLSINFLVVFLIGMFIGLAELFVAKRA